MHKLYTATINAKLRSKAALLGCTLEKDSLASFTYLDFKSGFLFLINRKSRYHVAFKNVLFFQGFSQICGSELQVNLFLRSILRYLLSSIALLKSRVLLCIGFCSRRSTSFPDIQQKTECNQCWTCPDKAVTPSMCPCPNSNPFSFWTHGYKRGDHPRKKAVHYKCA